MCQIECIIQCVLLWKAYLFVAAVGHLAEALRPKKALGNPEHIEYIMRSKFESNSSCFVGKDK
jgi:hypothetical protein